MKIFRILSTFVFCLLASLTASVSETEMDPSAIIGGCVNAITGNYVLSQEDLFVKGTQPISFRRTYATAPYSKTILPTSGGWKWLDHTRARMHKFEEEDRIYVLEPNGSMLAFRSTGGNFKKHPVRFNPAPDCLEGYCNTSRGKISGQNNLSNYYILTKGKLEGFDLFCPDGSKRQFRFVGPDGHGSQIFLLEKEIHPSGNRTHYEYLHKPGKSAESVKASILHPHTNALKRIWTSNPQEDKLYAEIAIDYSGKREILSNFTASSSDGQSISYKLRGLHNLSSSCHSRLASPKMYLLTHIEHSHLPNQDFAYRTKKTLSGAYFSEKTLPAGRGQRIFYYDESKYNVLPFTSKSMQNIKTIKLKGTNDARFGRVKQIDAPENESWRATHILVHYPNKTTKTDGTCDVYDAYDNLTRYTYNSDKRLKSIEQFSGNNKLLAKTTFRWNGHRLVSKTLSDSEKELSSRTYTYDQAGNVIEETLAGNGKHSQSTTTREYSQDGLNLLIKEVNPLGLITTYQYKPGTDLPVVKLQQGKSFSRRETFTYNNDNLLIEKTIDNGSSNIPNDLSGVSERRIAKFTLNNTGSFLGFPTVIKELYFDPATQSEIPLKTTHIQYNEQGNIAKKSIYDANGVLSYLLEFEYDSRGRLIREKDASNRWASYTYDANNNRIKASEFGGNEVKTHYDKRNRPVHNLIQTPENKIQTTSARYDVSNNIISSKDHLGRITSFKHNALGHITATQSPAYHKDIDQMITPFENQKHDAAGNVTLFEDSDGRSIQTKHNALNQPTRIIKGDTQETLTYYPSGLLKTHTQANGLVWHYEYDELGRKTFARAVHGHILKEDQWIYDAFHLIKHIDPAGYVTTHKYNSAGRKIETSRESHKTTYEYDHLNRPHKTIYHNDENTLIEIKELDILNRIIEERSEDTAGKILKKKRYAYDQNGNQTTIYRYIDNDQETKEQFTYDGFGRLTQHIDQEGHTSTTSYQSLHDPELGINLEKHITTDPHGVQTHEVFHPFGSAYESSRLANGQEIAKERTYRLKAGPITKQISTIYNPDHKSRTIETRWEYDSQLRPITQIEAANTDLQRTTRKSYTSSGRLLSLQKPDGVKIHHTYDNLDRLTKLESSDGTVHYSYAYNKNDQLTQAVDILTGQKTIRKWDAHGNLTYEKLGNGLELYSSYDQQNRRTSLKYPGGKTVNYVYDPTFMRAITQNDFKHTYDEYDLDGNLLKQSLGFDLGDVNYSIDKLSRTKFIKHAQFSHEIQQFDSVGNVKQAELCIHNNKHAQKYGYDDHYHMTEETSALPNQYVYDSHHNRLASNNGDYKIDHLNQVISSPEGKLTYDANGNPTKRGHTAYKYDALDRLIEITNGSGTHSYSYDYQHRRIQSKDPSGTKRYIFDHQNEIGSAFQDGSFIDRRILGIGQGAEIGAAVLIENHGRHYVPLHDLFGNLTTLLNDRGKLTNTSYDSFGKKDHALAGSSWGYSSKRMDPTGLIFFGRRYYDPELGRFLTPDPLGLSEGPNLYQFLQNNPLMDFDEYGLMASGMHPMHAMQCRAMALNTLNNPRTQGSLQAFTGATEVVAGAVMTLNSAGALTPVGFAIGAHGLDQFFTGLRTAFTGYSHSTVSEHLLQKTGFSQQNASMVNDCISIAGVLGGTAVIRAAQLSSYPAFDLPKRLANTPDLPSHPLKETKYSRKVLLQMEKTSKTGLPDFHGFPRIVDNYARYGTKAFITGNDGLNRIKISMNGSYKGRTGHFEWIIEADQLINHRIFIPKP